jgi:cell wall-associated NlpC family hydrolase
MEQTPPKNLSMIARININVADVRSEPTFDSERTSQGLYNELVKVLEKGQAMERIKFHDGHIGWIRKQFLSEYKDLEGKGPFFVNDDVTPGFEKPDAGSRRLTLIPYGCKINGTLVGDFLETSSDRYGIIYLPRHELLDSEEAADSFNPKSDDLIREAEKFLGTPYLWGGRSFFGMDCSGFVQTIMHRFGIGLPRDTKEQINAGRDVTREEIQPGDLLFFPRHVVMATSPDMYIHCSSSNGGVAYNSLVPQNPLYNKSLDESFIRAKRVLT